MTVGRRITIREVAGAAGVSIQTVSRVVNDRPDVAPETAERVRRVIAETGYAPNMFARGLTQGRSHVIGVVAYGLDFYGPSRILTGIESQAAETGYSISLNLIHRPEADTVDELLSGLLSRQVDGIIWAVPEVGDNRAWLRTVSFELPVPMMLVGGTGGPSIPSVAIDNRAIGCQATDHLIAGGARRVAIVTGPMTWGEARQRRDGWLETVVAHRLPSDESLVIEGDWTPGSGELAFQALFSRPNPIDAVFASNDQMALGVLHAAHGAGLRIPEDVAVVGADDIPEASHLWPSLTTVHQPLREAGALAVRELELAIRRARARRGGEHHEPQAILLEPELVVRESTRPGVPA